MWQQIPPAAGLGNKGQRGAIRWTVLRLLTMNIGIELPGSWAETTIHCYSEFNDSIGSKMKRGEDMKTENKRKRDDQE